MPHPPVVLSLLQSLMYGAGGQQQSSISSTKQDHVITMATQYDKFSRVLMVIITIIQR